MEADGSNSTMTPGRSRGGRLILKPALRRGRFPDDDALFLLHGKGLARFVFVDFEPPRPVLVGGELHLGKRLTRRIADWVKAWQIVEEGLPRHCSPAHCRELDLQRHNREGLAICREVVPLLPIGQQLCFRGAKRKDVHHRSLLLEEGKPRTPRTLPAYYGEDRDPAKWVRVMGDYASTGIWKWSGAEMDPDDLPVSPELKTRLAAWARRFFTSADTWHEGEADCFERIQEDDRVLRAYSDEGFEIARAIKDRLPDWTVVYFDVDLAGRHVNRDRFQFEVM